MLWLIASLLYSLVGVLVGCRVATLLAWHWMADWNREWVTGFGSFKEKLHPSGEQWFGGACIGLLVACIWPVAVCAFLVRGVLFAPPERIKLKRQQEEIARLERELELTR